MTPLRSVLGLLWLAGSSAWMLPLPCVHLWRAWGYRSVRVGARNGTFAAVGAVKQLCFIVSGIVAGLSAFWWEHLYLCLETALTLLLLGVWLIFFEAPIDGLFDADDEEVLSNEEMLSLWYGGLNAIYARARSRWGMDYSFSRTRAWFWDDPKLRAVAYYFKAQGALLVLLVVLLGMVTGTISMVADVVVTFYQPYPYKRAAVPDLPVRILMTLFTCTVFFPFAWTIRREWMAHYRELVRAVKEGLDPDLADRARLAEMRCTIWIWACRTGYFRRDKERIVWNQTSSATEERVIG